MTSNKQSCHSTLASRPLRPSSCLAALGPSCKTQGWASCQWGARVGWTEQRKQQWQLYPRRPRGRSRAPLKPWNDPLRWCHTDTQPSQSPAWRPLEGTALHSCSLQWPGERESGINVRHIMSCHLKFSRQAAALRKRLKSNVPMRAFYVSLITGLLMSILKKTPTVMFQKLFRAVESVFSQSRVM